MQKKKQNNEVFDVFLLKKKYRQYPHEYCIITAGIWTLNLYPDLWHTPTLDLEGT
jgi:hypothetical protein